MKPQRPTPTRPDRLEFLLNKQMHVRQSRLRRRNTAIVTMMFLLVGGLVWVSVPSRPAAQPQRPQQASAPQVSSGSDPAMAVLNDDRAFSIAKVDDAPLQITMLVSNSEPRRVEYINDLQLLIAMRQQGIDAGLMRQGGQTQLAFNDEESRKRFERGVESAE